MVPRLRLDPPHALGRPPRVALVHDWLTGLRGGEKCLEAICALFPDATVYTLVHREGSVGPTIGRHRIECSPLQHLPSVHRYYRALLPLMPWAASTWRVGEVDLVLSLSHCVAKAVRVPEGVPHLCYCFTPMRYAWDGREAYLERWRRSPIKRTLANRVLDRFQDWDRATASNVTGFVTISQTVADRVRRHYGRESAIVPPPVNVEFYVPAPVARDGPYLVVSALVPYKRVDHAVAACTALGRELVVIGSGPERPRLEKLAGPTVRFLGWRSDEEIRDQLRRCRALLFPGAEDFGIVPIEALACGAPVVALGRGGAAETVDGRVGAIYDEESPQGLASAIQRWEAAGRPHDPRLARAKAEAFAAPLFAQRMASLVASALSGQPRRQLVSHDAGPNGPRR